MDKFIQSFVLALNGALCQWAVWLVHLD